MRSSELKAGVSVLTKTGSWRPQGKGLRPWNESV